MGEGYIAFLGNPYNMTHTIFLTFNSTTCSLQRCLVDGLYDASSAFKAPRPGPETLQFTVDMFQFVNDSRNMVIVLLLPFNKIEL